MNILIPHNWLLEHLDTKATPKQIQEYLSLCGPSVERIYDNKGEKVYDIEVTTNRVDSMSIRGIAREAAVILEQFGVKASLKPLTLSKPKVAAQETLPLPKIISNYKLSKRIMCVILSNVQRAPTPSWMGERLQQIDQNIHDSAIDITNYVTHSLGHPCHAFDYDKIMKLGGEIRVVEAQKGKQFTTLDGEEYTTVGGEVVFENQAGEIIDLPAIKGTANTSIDDTTKNILFWIESLDAKKVRFASMKHAIRTVAAQLNEKNVDPNLEQDVLYRGIELYQKLCDAKVASKVFDDFPDQTNPPSIKVSLKKINNYLGLELKPKLIINILTKLGCTVKTTEKEIIVTPPTNRGDIQIPVDVIEEIARIYGYHNLPSVVMPTRIPLTKPSGVDFSLERKIKHFLGNIGWQEVYTYSMVGEEVALESGHSLDTHLKLSNPLTEDKVYLRRSLVPSLKEVLTKNPQRKTLSVFEIANVYHPQKNNLPIQNLLLSLVSSKPFRFVKGDLESLLKQFFITSVSFKEKNSDQGQSAKIVINSKKEKQILGTLKVIHNLTMIEIKVHDLLKAAKFHPTYQPTPKTSPIIEDLTFTLQPKTSVGKVIERMQQTSPLVLTITLKEIYKNNYTFTIEYLDTQKNLSNETVEPLRRKVVEAVQQDGAKLVGKI